MPTRHDVVEANTQVFQLIQLDALWTGLSRNKRDAAQDPFELLEVARRFQLGILNIAHYVNEIADVAADEEFRQIPDDLREDLSADSNGEVTLLALERHDNSLAALARHAANEVSEHERDELRQLETDLRDLLAGGTPKGYFGKSFLCGLAMASMAAGLITVWVPPHAHAPAAVGFGATVYKSTKCGE